MDKLKDEALLYVRRVMEVLSFESPEFKEFFCLMSNFDHGIIDSAKVSLSVKALFEGHKDLIDGFSKFLPENYGVAEGAASSAPPSSSSSKTEANAAGSSCSRQKRKNNPCSSGNKNKLARSIKFLNGLRKDLGDDGMYRKFLQALDEYGCHKDIHLLDSISCPPESGVHLSSRASRPIGV